MELELSQLIPKYSALRLRDPHKLSRLTASVARQGQQIAIFVVVSIEDAEQYVLIDGYARVEALVSLGRDVCEASVLDLTEADALVMSHRLASRAQRSALEEAWLLRELVEEHGYSLRSLASRLGRSVSFISRRLSLVQTLPSSVQEVVRAGHVPPHAAMKYLAPLARANIDHVIRLVEGLTERVSDRQVERLYLGWRQADDEARERLVSSPLLFLKAEAAMKPEPAVPEGDPASGLLRDLEAAAGCCRRARRRVRHGLLNELDDSRLQLVERVTAEARLAFDSLSALLSEGRCSTTTSAQRS